MMLNKIWFSAGTIILGAVFAAANFAQSSDQAFPTPVTANVIEASIAVRDVGDSRLTTYYYTFDSGQGDLFMNIVSNNLTGDIDIFSINGMLQLTKVSVYGDLSESETGRVLYFRKPERLLLRIQGRSPNDEPATVTIKFAGSFIAASGGTDGVPPELPTVAADNDSDVIVNSVGTVIGRRSKPEPEKEVAKTKEKVRESTEPAKPKPEVVVTEKAEPVKKAVAKTETPKPTRRNAQRRTEKVTEKNEVTARNEPTPEREQPVPTEPVTSEKASVTEREIEREAAESTGKNLANIKLVVIFKNGTKIERPMDQVLRFSVDNGVLTIISMDGRIGRYSIFDIERTVIE